MVGRSRAEQSRAEPGRSQGSALHRTHLEPRADAACAHGLPPPCLLSTVDGFFCPVLAQMQPVLSCLCAGAVQQRRSECCDYLCPTALLPLLLLCCRYLSASMPSSRFWRIELGRTLG